MTKVRRAALPAAVAAAFLLLWEAAVATWAAGLDTISPPSEAAAAWARLAAEGDVARHTAHTVGAFLISWTLAVAAGVFVGAAVGSSSVAARLLLPLLTFMRFIPPPVLVPVVLLVSGFRLQSEVTVAAYAAAWPVVLNAAAGVRSVEPRLVDVGRTLCLGRWRRFTKLVLPSAMPDVAAGARIAAATCLVVVVTAEMIGVPRGIGYQIVRAGQSLRPAETYAYILWTGVVGVAIHLVLTRLEDRVLAWHPSRSAP